MKYQFTLSQYPKDNFEIEISIWTSKAIFRKNGVELSQSNHKGKPFLLETDTGMTQEIYVKNNLPDYRPSLEINGEKIEIIEKLKWYQYAIGGTPIILLFVGGLVGGAIGGGISVVNFSIFRGEDSEMVKYLKVIGLSITGYVVYFILAGLIYNVTH